MKKERIDILLACYNGERYIRNQLLSLQQQTHNNWHLYIRDDGSTDNTLNIINEFVSIDSRITLITDNKKKLGPALNFKELFKYSSANYVICCDQDDIWFEKKIESLLREALEKFEQDKPCIVYCDGYGYDSLKGIITIESISTLHATTLNEFLFFNAGYQGCSILMNKELASMFNEYNQAFYMHDNIISLLAHTFGKVFFIPDKLMLYRQHEKNVTGNIKKRSLYTKIFKERRPIISEPHLQEKQNFYKNYIESLDLNTRRIFDAYFRFSKSNNLITNIYILYKYNFKLGQCKYRLYLKLLLRPVRDFKGINSK